jgi:hypothetical protein
VNAWKSKGEAKVAEVFPDRGFRVVKILFYAKPSPMLSRWQGLSACLGIGSEEIDISIAGSLAHAVSEAISQKESSIVLDVGSLRTRCPEEELGTLADYLKERQVAVLLLVSDVDESACLFLRILTNNAIRGIMSAGQPSRLRFPASSDNLSKELASYSFVRRASDSSGLVLSSPENVEVVMTLDESPTFVRVSLGKTNVFVWITNVVFDVFRPLAAELEFEEAADEYIPAIIFLRFAFGKQCWHNPSPGAGIVIDDPLLSDNYGFIKFRPLLESARRNGYHVTLAFIPWNHWRSRARKVQMFLNYSDCFSVCAHGCDHTKSEFLSTDYDELLSRNFVAHERMSRHHRRTGLPSAPLMVCPQEQYSLQAMQAFADSRQFIGLVNTACMPRNLVSPAICGADLLLPAQDSFFGFPVFKRHYWTNLSVFAMSLFLGKPAILVEHHDFFRDGPGRAEGFAEKLGKLHPNLRWTSLAETIMRTHLRRQLSEDKWELRFFTDRFTFQHEEKTPVEYRLISRVPATTVVRRVMCNGAETAFLRDDGSLAFSIQVKRPQTIQVHVDVAPVKPTKMYSPGFKYQASVTFRRGLSEFRDNVIARNGFALRASQRLVKVLGKTAG